MMLQDIITSTTTSLATSTSTTIAFTAEMNEATNKGFLDINAQVESSLNKVLVDNKESMHTLEVNSCNNETMIVISI